MATLEDVFGELNHNFPLIITHARCTVKVPVRIAEGRDEESRGQGTQGEAGHQWAVPRGHRRHQEHPQEGPRKDQRPQGATDDERWPRWWAWTWRSSSGGSGTTTSYGWGYSPTRRWRETKTLSVIKSWWVRFSFSTNFYVVLTWKGLVHPAFLEEMLLQIFI